MDFFGLIGAEGGKKAQTPILIEDWFNRADSVGTIGMSSSGHLWENIRSVWSLVANNAKPSSGGSPYIAQLNGGIDDADVSAYCDLSTLIIGPAAKIKDGNNCVYAAVGSGKIALYKRIAGVETLISSASVSTPSGLYIVRLKLTGLNVEVYLDGELKLSDVVPETGGYGVGLYSTSTSNTFYQFSATGVVHS